MATLTPEARAQWLQQAIGRSNSSNLVKQLYEQGKNAEIGAQLRIRFPKDFVTVDGPAVLRDYCEIASRSILGIDNAQSGKDETVVVVENRKPPTIYEPLTDTCRPATQADIDSMERALKSLGERVKQLACEVTMLKAERAALTDAVQMQIIDKPADVSYVSAPQQEIDRIWDAVKAACGR